MNSILRHICRLFPLVLFALVVGGTPAQAQGRPTRIFLPLLPSPPTSTVFGLEMIHIAEERGLDLLVSSKTRWVRRNALHWKEIEPVEGGGYRWDGVETRLLEAELVNAQPHNFNLILVVHGSPSWATRPYGVNCAPINPNKQRAFAQFLAAAVERYSQPPYNIKYWEIGNEPDAYVFRNDAQFGCWGIKTDPYYGGEAYGELLKVAYTTIKSIDPQAKVLNGGLLLDRAYDPQNETATRAGRFFEGMLRVGAGDFFDIVSFHTYAFFDPSPNAPLGVVEDWRVAYLRDTMRRFNVPEKPLIRTETAMLCTTVTPECRWAQADYLGRVFTRAIRDQLLGNLWYAYDDDGYHGTALIEPSDVFVPRPSYFAYRQAARMLSGATYLGPLDGQAPGVEGYRFENADRQVIAVWSDAPQVASIPVVAGSAISCSMRDGGVLPCNPEGGVLRLATVRGVTYIELVEP